MKLTFLLLYFLRKSIVWYETIPFLTLFWFSFIFGSYFFSLHMLTSFSESDEHKTDANSRDNHGIRSSSLTGSIFFLLHFSSLAKKCVCFAKTKSSQDFAWWQRSVWVYNKNINFLSPIGTMKTCKETSYIDLIRIYI